MRRLATVLSSALLLLPLALPSPAAAAVAPGDDGLLVWAAANGGVYAVHSDDGSGYRPFEPGSPSWAPDGRHVVVTVLDQGGERYPALRDVVSGAQRVLSAFPGTDAGSVALHPDGRRLAVRRGNPSPALFVADLDGGGRTEVSLPEGGSVHAGSTAWDPTGRALLVQSSGAQAVTWALDDGSTRLRRLLPERATSVSWSPDGSAFAAVMTMRTDVRVFDRDGRELRRLPTPLAKGVGDVAWSPRGTRIALTSDADNHVWTVRPDGSGLVQFDRAPFAKLELGWQPAQPVASLGLTTSASSVTSPQQVRLSLSSRGAQGAAVELLARPAELTGRTTVARLHLDQAGLGSVVLAPSRATCWVLRSRRQSDGALVSSPERCTTVRWSLSAAVPARSGRTLAVPVRVGPAVARTLVQLQTRGADGRWTTRGSARTAADGTTRVSAALPRGRHVVRVAVPSASGRTGVVGRATTVTVG